MKKRLRIMPLEPRILLDASLVPTAVDTVPDSAETTTQFEAVFNSLPDNCSEQTDSAADTSPPAKDESGQWVLLESDKNGFTPEPTQKHPLEIIVVDTSISDYQTLIEGVDPDAEILCIDPSQNGFKYLGDILNTRSEINAIHIFSHGSEGSLTLGADVLNDQTLDSLKPALTNIGNALASDGDILLYGCNFAEGETGVDFVKHLSLITGADIAASDDLTGNNEKGGDWKLETTTGLIDTQQMNAGNFDGVLGFASTVDGTDEDDDHNNDGIADPLRMITWNVIGLDSNKPETEGPNKFMVGLRVNADSDGLSNLNVKIVDDDGIDIFGTGIIFADDTAATSDIDDGVDNIQFTGQLEYTGESIAANSYKDFYFNAEVLRSLSSHDQLQAFHFDVFEDNGAGGGIAGNGIQDGGEVGETLTKFSWLPDANAANTPLYLYVEKYISQARNDVVDQTYPTEAAADDSYAAIRIEGFADSGNYTTSSVTVFVGQTLNIRVEGQTATQGYSQLTLSTVFDTDIYQINNTSQYYDKPVTELAYQQDLGTGEDSDDNFDTLAGTENTSVYANPAGWNPATHSTMITSAPPKAGGGPIVTDYEVIVSGTGSGKLETLILDYSGSSFHYNADLNNGIEAIDYVNVNAVSGAILGNVAEDTDGDNVGDSNISGVTITLTGSADTNMDGVADTPIAPQVTTTDASGNYKFTDLLPGDYTVTESAINGYGDVTDSDGTGSNDKNTVAVTLSQNPLLGYAPDDPGTLLGFVRADFVEGRPDLSLSKTVDSATPMLGGNVVFTLTVTNTSAADAAQVEVTEKLPAGLTYVSDSTGGVSYDSATGVWSVGSVSAGSSENITITATVNTDTPITNFAEITSIKDAGGNNLADPDSTVGNNAGADSTYGTSDDGSRTPFEDDEAKITIDAQEADLGLIKTWSNVSDPGDNPNVGETVTFTLLISNTGPDNATNVKVTDILPTGLNFVSASGDSSGTDAGGGIWNIDAGETYNTANGEWSVGTIANGTTAKLTITATVNNPASLTNYAEITASDQYDPDSSPTVDRNTDDGSDGLPDDDEASVQITPHAADLSLGLITSNLTPDTGDTITYTMILNNSGPDTATGVVVTQSLPAGVTYVSGGSSHSAGTVTWNAGDLGSGVTLTQVITVTVNSSGTLTSYAEVKSTTNFAVVSDPDSKPTDNGGTGGVAGSDDWGDGAADDDEDSVTITPGAADLSLTKSFVVTDGTLDTLNDTITFTLRVTNNSGNDVYNVRVEDTMSSGLTFNSVTSVDGSFDGSFVAGKDLWDIDTLGAGQTATLIYVADVDSVIAQSNFAEIIEADATVDGGAPNGTSTLTDADSTFNNDSGALTADEDDEAKANIPAIDYADLEVETSVSTASAAKNEVFDFYITVTNNGFKPTTGVVVQNIIDDSKYSVSSWSSTDGTDSYSYNSGTGTWTLGSLAVGEQATLTITGSSSANTPAIINYAQVTASDLPDPDSTVNNGTSPNPVEDDEDAISTGLASSRYDVALTQSVARGGGKTAADNLVAADQVTFTLTAVNQGSDIVGNAYVMNRWPAGLTLSSANNSDAGNGGQLEYSTDGGLTFSSTFSANPDYIRWQVDNSSSGTKFVAGTSATLTLVGTVNTTGEGANIAENSAWWSMMATKADDDSSVPDVSVFTQVDGAVGEVDITTDDKSDGQIDDDESSVSVGGNQSADLSISKLISTDGTQTFTDSAKLNDGTVVTFKIVATNNAASVAPATNVVVEDVLPTGMVYRRSYGDGTYNNATGEWSVGDLPKGATASLYIVAEVDWDATGASTITNTAEVIAADQSDPDSTVNNGVTTEDDYDSLTITEQLPEADLRLSKTVSTTMPDLNSNVTFTLTVSNDGPNAATNVVVSDLLPSGLTYVSQSGDGTYIDSDINSQYDTWTVGTVANGSTATISIVAQVTSTETLTNFAEISASDLDDPDSTAGNGDQNPDEDDEAAASLTAKAADLSLSKSVSDTSPNVGDSINLILTVINSGPNAATGVTVNDSLPSGFTQTGTAFNATATGDTYAGGVWTLGNVGIGEVHTLTITGTVDSAAAFRDFAEISASDLDDPDSTVNNDSGETVDEDDEASVTVTPQAADLSLAKSVDNASPNLGDNVTFTLKIINSGPLDATNVEVKDYLPAGMTWVSGGSHSGGTVTWSPGTVAVGEVKTISIVATVTNASALKNFAEITAADQADPDSTINNDSGQTADEDDEAAVTVDARQIDLKLDKAVSRATPHVGETVIFTLTITNEGTDDATGVTIRDNFPANLTYVTSSASDGGVFNNNSTAGDTSDDTITWTGLNIAAGEIKVLTFEAVVGSGISVSNVAQVTAADQPDSDSTPNDGVGDDYATVSVDGQQADLTLAKTVDSATPAYDDTVTFTLTVHNNGPDSATNVMTTDKLPAGLEFVSATGDGSYNQYTGQWTIGTIPNGDDAVLTLKAKVKSPAVINNFAEISASDQPDNTSTVDNDNGNKTANEDDEAIASLNAELIDLDVTQTIDNYTPVVNDVVTYVVTVTNRNGFDTATGISVADALPAGLDISNAGAGHGVTASAGSYAAGVWNGFDLAGGGSATLTIKGRVTDVTQLINAAEITAAGQTDIDSTPGNGYSTPATEAEDDWAIITPNMGTISGKVMDDRTGFTPGEFDAGDSAISGVTVKLFTDVGGGTPGVELQSTTTDDSGAYSFNAVAGNYVVVETDKVGYISVRDMEDINGVTGAVIGDTTDPGYNRIPVTVVAGNEYTEKNFLDLTPWTISGVVYTDNGTTTDSIDGGDTGIDGVTVTLKKDTDGNPGNGYEQTVGTVNTSGGGAYSFGDLGPGLYRVEETDPGTHTSVADSEGHTSDPAWNRIDVTMAKGSADSTGNNFLDTAVPDIDLDVADTGTKDYSDTFTAGGSAVKITNTDAVVIDLDDTAMASFTMTFAGLQDGADEKLTIGGTVFSLNADKTSTNIAIGGTNFDIAYTQADGKFIVTKNSGGDMPESDLNTLMRGTTYQDTKGTVTTGNRTITFVTNDGNDDSNTATSTIAVNNVAANPPVNTVPGAQTVNEQTQTGINGLSVTDTNGNLTTSKLTVTGGAINVDISGGATISAGANDSATLTLSGTEAQTNAALATVKYTSNNGTTSDTLTILSTDGTSLTDSDVVNITVQDPPVNTVPGAKTVTEQTQTAIGGLSVTDTNGNLSSSKLTVTGGAINVDISGGATISAGANDSATLTLSGTEAQINAALATVKYTSNNGTTTDTLTILSTDGTSLTDSDVVNITVQDPPVNTVPGAKTVTEQTQTAIAGLSVTDTNGNLSSSKLTVTGGAINVDISGGATISAGANDSATLTLSGTEAQINAALATVKYTSNNGTTSDTLTILSTDGTSLTDSDVVNIAVQDPPVNTVPGAKNVAEQTQTVIAGLSVTDTNGNLSSSKLTVTGGVLNVDITGGATISAGSNDSATLTLSGTEAQINAALATVKYTSNNGTTSDTLTILSTDGTSLTDSDVVNITVQDPPVNTVPGAKTVTEQTQTAIAGLSVTDTNGNLSSSKLTVTGGVINVNISGGATISAGANDSATLTLSGTEAQINAALATVKYTSNNGTTSDTLTVLSTDGSSLTDSDVVNITVQDPPVNTVPGAKTVTEQTQTAIAGLSVTDTNGNLSSSKLTVTGGVINVNISGGATISAGANDSATLTLSGTEAQINAALATVKYTSNNGTTSDTLTVLSTDGSSLTDSDVVNITVQDPPVNTVPGAKTVTEQTQTAIGGLSVTDTNGNLSSSKLTVTGGAINVDISGGATISAGANDSATLTLSGTEAQINAALATVKYTSNNGTTTDTLTILSTDGTSLTDSDVVNITVQDPPVNTVPGAKNVAEQTQTVIAGLSVTDTNGNLSSSKLTVTGGVLNVDITGGATISAGANDSATLTLSGTEAQINAALATVKYTSNNGTTSDTLTILSTDGTSLTDSDVVNITVQDPPVNTVPGAKTVAEQTQTAITGLSVTDTNGNLSSSKLTVTGGAINVNVSGGATISAGSNDSATLTLSGTEAQINAALATVKYTSNNGTTSDTLTILSTDGTSLTDSDVVNITVQDQPVNTVPGAKTVTEQTQTVIAGLSVTDTNGNLSSSKLTVTGGVLNVDITGGATISAGANDSATLTLSGSETQINAALATVKYTSNNGTTADTLTILSTDGTSLTDSDVVNITVQDPPVNTVPGAKTVAEQTQTAITGLSVTDTNGNLSSSKLTVTSGAINVNVSGGATISAGSNDSATLTLSGTEAQINAALATVKYTSNNGTTADTLTILSTDGTSLTDSDVVNITVQDPPVNTVPGAKTVAEQTQTAITGLSVTDTNGNLSSSKLTVTGGAINVSISGGATISAGSNDSATLTLSGTEAQINAALATVKYTSNNGTTADTLTILSTDGTSLTDSDVVNITVQDPPVNTVPGAKTVAEQTQTAITGLSVTDTNGNLSSSKLTVTGGAINVNVSGGATISAGSNDSATLTLSGTEAQINAALATVKYTSNNGTTADTLTILSTDGTSLTDSDVVNITVQDPPVNTVPGAKTVAEQTQTAITGLSVTDTNGNLSSSKLTVTGGAINVNVSGGATISAGSNDSATLTLSGTEAQINAALATVKYTSNNGTTADTLTILSTDGTSLTDSDVVNITVQDPPVNTVPGAKTVAEQTQTAITGLSVTDTNGNLSSSKLTVTGGAINVNVSGGATISAGSNDSATLTLSGTEAQINAALATVKYTSDNGTTSDTLTILSSDGTSLTDSDVVNITIQDPPVNTVPGAKTVAEQTQTAITGLSVTDTNGNLSSSKLTVTGGAINVNVSGGATISAGSNDSATLTLSGTEAQINAALATVKYTSNNGTTADTLTILSTDGTSLTDSDVVAITVTTGSNSDLVTVKTLASGDSTPNEGDTVIFQITVTNNGTAQATNVSLTDSLPSGITLTGNTPSVGSYTTATGVWSIGSLNSGSSAILTLTGTVDVGEGGKTITNTTTAATGDQPDPTTTGDDLTETVVVDNNVPTVPTPPTPTRVPAPAPPPNPNPNPGPGPGVVPNIPPTVSSEDLFTNDFSDTNPYHPSMNPVSLSGEVSDQFVTEGIVQMSVGDGEFKHTDPSETLKYEGTLADGSPLPDYISFNTATGVFEIDADGANSSGARKVEIRVVARDSQGNRAASTFQVFFSEDAHGFSNDQEKSQSETGGVDEFGSNGNEISSESSGEQQVASGQKHISAGAENHDIDPSVSTNNLQAGGDAGVAQSLSADLSDTPIIFTGELEDHRISVGEIYEFSIPEDAYQHSNPAETIAYAAYLSDGSPLPEFIQFDPQSGYFNVVAPPGVQNLDIVVTAYDSAGNEVSATFSIFFEEIEEEDEDQIGSNNELATDVPLEPEMLLHTLPESVDDLSSQSGQADESGDPSQGNAKISISTQESDGQDSNQDDEGATGKAGLNEQLQGAGHFGYQHAKNHMVKSILTLFSDGD